MTNELHQALALMERSGGGFASAIAVAAMRADNGNLSRLLGAFPELFARYTQESKEVGVFPPLHSLYGTDATS